MATSKSPSKRRSTKKAPARATSSRSRTSAKAGSTVPKITGANAGKATEILQDRLYSLLDLQLTLKHIHWNVTGPTFIAVHEMLDPQVLAVREMSDAVAERIATLGSAPLGTPGAIVKGRKWDDYDLGRDSTDAHLNKLDAVYRGVIEDHREALEQLEDLDPVSEDLLTGQLGELELFAWFIRSHLGN
jgi:starvation-inducible DNA-binding protein